MKKRFFNDYLAAVRADDWERAIHGADEEERRFFKARIAEALDGVDLYYHAGPEFGDDYIWVTLADLLCHGIVLRVTLHKE